MSSQEYDKNITVQHKKMKATLPKIVSPAMMDTCEAELSDDISPIDNEEGVNYRKCDKNKKYYGGKEAECQDETSTVDMEEGVNDRKDESNEKHYEGKRQNSLMTLPLMLLRKV